LKRQLTRSGIEPPVVFITANASEATRKAAMEAGCVAYLQKPFPTKLLMDAIEAALLGPPRSIK
jgi:CheY-like chemotaxis protein